MILSNPIGWVALVASLCQAGPVAVAPALPPAHLARGNDLVIRNALDKSVEVARGLEERASASFDLSHSWDNEMLFDGKYPNGVGGTVEISVLCSTCYIKGTIDASITDHKIIDPVLRLDFTGVTAYVDLAIAVSESAVYTINLFTSNTPIGMSVAGISVGVVFAVDLIFSLSDKIEMDAGGFQVTLADGAYVEASLLEGAVTKSLFDGTSAHSLPVSVKSGTATFKADLRIRTQCGVEGTILHGIGAGLEVGVYANIIEFNSILETTETCGLQARENWDINVGAYALADVEIDYKTFGAVPTISTTLLTAPTATQCWGSIASAVTSALGGGGGAKYDGSTSVTFVSSASSSTQTASYGSDSGPVFSSSATFVSSASSSTQTASYGSDSGPVFYSSVSGPGYYNSSSSAPHSASASTSGSAAAFSPSVNSSSPASSSSAASSSPVVVSSSSPAAVSSTPSAAAVSSAPASTITPPPTSSAALSTSASVTAFSVSASIGGGAVTSTVLSTTTYTITSCAASVVNCPAKYQTSYVVTKTYTNKVCSTGTGSPAVVTTTNGAHLALMPTATNVVVLVPCTSPIVHTFTPPTALPTAAKGNGGSGSGSGSSPSGLPSSSGSSGSSGNSTLSGTLSPTPSKTGSAFEVAVTAGAVSASIVRSSLAAAVGVFAAALLL